MTTEPALSVIVPTYQGADRILNTLGSLERQAFRRFEVIVVIDGSTDNTHHVITNAAFTFPLHIHVQPNKGRAGARNAGVLTARANTLVFFDDDLIFADDLLTKYHALVKEQHPIVVGTIYAVSTSANDDFFNYSKYLDAKWLSPITQTKRNVLKNPYLSAANCMINADVFKQLGGFDERLRDAEDFDLAVKAFAKEIPILMDAEIPVGHHLHPDFKTYAHRMTEYQKAKQILIRLNPIAAKYLSAPEQRGRLKTVLYTLLSGGVWIDLIDKGVFDIFPRSFRYRLYDLLLTAYSVTRAGR